MWNKEIKISSSSNSKTTLTTTNIDYSKQLIIQNTSQLHNSNTKHSSIGHHTLNITILQKAVNSQIPDT